MLFFVIGFYIIFLFFVYFHKKLFKSKNAISAVIQLN
jgi:hypothetical protein